MPSKPAPARRIPDSPRARWTVRRVGAALVTCALTAAVAAGCTTLPQPPGGAAATIGPPASRTWTFPLLTTKAAIRRGSQTATGQFEKVVLHQPDELPPLLQRGGHHGTDRHAGAVTGVRRGRHDAHRPVE